MTYLHRNECLSKDKILIKSLISGFVKKGYYHVVQYIVYYSRQFVTMEAHKFSSCFQITKENLSKITT